MAKLNPVKFFCEFCGSQVRAADRICPHCGSFFSQVRCPACGFQGENKLFSKGCPVCGFAAAKNLAKPPATGGKSSAGSVNKTEKPMGYVIHDDPLRRRESAPVWVLPVLIGLFLGVIALAIVVLQATR